MENDDKKGQLLKVLHKIKESTPALFTSKNDKCSRENKSQEWEKIHNYAISLGLISPMTTQNIIKEKIWRNAKKKALRNKDKVGEIDKLDAQDETVLDIIRIAHEFSKRQKKHENRENPSNEKKKINLVPVFKKYIDDSDENSNSREYSQKDDKLKNELEEELFSSSSNTLVSGKERFLNVIEKIEKQHASSKRCKKRPKITENTITQTEEPAWKRKIELEIEQISLQNKKLRLEIMKLENDLKVDFNQCSSVAQEIHPQLVLYETFHDLKKNQI